MAGKRKERRRGDGSSSPNRRKERRRGDGSSSPNRSSSAGISREETPATRSPDIHSMIEELTKKQAEGFKQTHEELKEIKQTLDELKEIKQTVDELKEKNKSEPNQMQPPSFSLKIKSKVVNPVEKGESIMTDHGDLIVVDLYDGGNPIASNHPLASAKVRIVVLKGKFNSSRCSWSKGDFEASIESTVDNCIFRLDGGTGRHSGATILENSRNSKVKLGVTVVPDDSYGTYKDERVLEGVSKESFLVRDPPRPSKKQKGAVKHFQIPSAEQAQYLSWPTSNTQTAGNISGHTNMPSSSSTPGDNTLGANTRHWVEPSTNSATTVPVISDSMNPDGGVQPWTLHDAMLQHIRSSNGGPYSEHIMRPVQLLWDRPGVEPIKHWNLLDQLMPLYSSQTKIHSGDFPTMRFMPLTPIPKEVMQTHRSRGVLIQPLEPDDSDDEPPLKRILRNKYQLRFVNKVCEAYYTGDKIKAEDGNLLNVALYDENNAKITSGPLSSASVEVVVLHGDFNATGQDYWASEEFSSCVVCPQSTKEPPAIGGDRVLVLVDGQASLGDAFFQKSSIYARTGKFKMGVMLASTPDDRVQEGVQEGISEPFWVWNRKGGSTGCTVFQRWHRAINAISFIWRLQSETYRARSIRRPLLSRDTGDACLELPKEEQCMQDSFLDAWMSGVQGFGVQLPKAAVTKNVTLLDPRNKGTPYHKMLIKRDIRDVQNEEYLPFADVKENDNEDAAEEAHDGNSGKENAEGIKQKLEEQKEELKEEINKIQRQLNKLSHIVLRTQLEQLNGSSGDGSPAPRSEPNQMQPPRFSLKIKSKIGNTVEKEESIKTDHGDLIVVELYDGGNLIAPSHPLASAKVMMVVLDGNFNNSRRSWPKVDFEKSIKRPRQRNSTIGDVNQGIESIVNNCVFYLKGGTGRHSGAKIWENSGNRKVKLGVMVLPDDSYGEYKNERVLEGVSKESFLVQDPSRPSKKQKEAVEDFRSPLAEQAPVGCGQERNGPMHGLMNQTMHSLDGGVQQWISDSMNQAMHNLDGGVQPWISDLANQPMHGPYGTPYHKMLIKWDIRDVQNEEYLPFADVKENDNEDAAEEAHDGNSGKEKGLENTHGASSISMQTLQFVPNIRSDSFAETGDRSCMEDERIHIDDLYAHLVWHLGPHLVCPLPSALYGVFDGHGGPDAAAYMKKHATKFLFEDCDFPKAWQVDEAFLQSVQKSVRRAFSQADLAMRNDISRSSGTTALIALVFGRQLLVANAGDCRAVLCRKGVAIEMSRDNGVSLGDWGMKGSGGSAFPIIPEPEIRQTALTGDDEFLILASGGLWDVMTSTSAVHVARRELSKHGDPKRCARELVSQRLRLGATKNLTVIVVCFH